MKSKPFKIIAGMFLLMIVSCDEPETVVTNYVHPDGSVTRKIEMRNIKNIFQESNLQVPFDSTWVVKDSIEIGEKGDTTWVKRAEKLFSNTDEINHTYKMDSGANRSISRKASFKKTFRWFNTGFRFSENIDKKLSFGYPLQDFLNQEELNYFYSPSSLKSKKESGPDSLKYKLLNDSINRKTEKWATKTLVSEWIGEFAKLTKGRIDDAVYSDLKARENEIIAMVELNSEKFDSLWESGIILQKVLPMPDASEYKAEADSAVSIVTAAFWTNFKDYSVRIVMPGRLTGTNGFIDSSNVLLWQVKSDFFLTQPYEMWAESKVPNLWAWILSGLFLIFVITGVIIRALKKAE